MVHPKNIVAFNRTVWDETSMQVQAGIGVRNFWTWTNLKPKGAQRDVIVNSVSPPTNLSPFNIPGAQGSWATELVWGPADAHRPGRAASPVGGRERHATHADHGRYRAACRHEVA